VVFRHAGIVCALYKGKDKTYILDAKELNGDIVSNVDDAIIFLKKHLRIRAILQEMSNDGTIEKIGNNRRLLQNFSFARATAENCMFRSP